MLKNRIFSILIILTLMTPVFAEEPASSEVIQQQEQTTVAPQAEGEQTSVVPDTALNTGQKLDPEQINLDPNSYKQPTSKRKIAKKFLLAMLGVAVSSIALFVILSLYNRIRNVFQAPSETEQNQASLVTPDNLTDAVRTFLDKTNY